MLTYEYINPLKQLGYAQYDLCIKDGETCVARFTKTFPEGVTLAEMANYASEMAAVTEAEMALGQQEAQP